MRVVILAVGGIVDDILGAEPSFGGFVLAYSEHDAVGRFTVYGLMENSATARSENLIPLGLTDGAVLRRDAKMDEMLTFDDVDLPDDRVSLALWDEQVAQFPLGLAGATV